MIDFMLVASSCGFFSNGISVGYGGAWASDWLEVNMLIVLAIFSVSSIIYAISGFLSGGRREKLRSVVRYEIFEAFVSIIIIFVIMWLSQLMCYAGATLSNSPSYPGVFAADEQYVGNLVFGKGAYIASQIYTQAVAFIIAGQINAYIMNTVIEILGSITPATPYIYIPANFDFESVFASYQGLLLTVFAPVTLVIFSVLLILFLSLPIIQAISLTIILPVAIVMRSIGYAGTSLRKTSNEFIALAIGLFFILPVTISFDNYITSCLNFMPGTHASCSWLTGNELKMLSPTPLPSGLSPLFGASSSLSAIGIFSTSLFGSGLIPGLSQILTLVATAPSIIFSYADEIAEYAFVGIMLVAFDLLVTTGFTLGLARGLNAVGEFGERFW